MGVNAEGKISLSVELQNFKDIASDLKKGLSAQLKQVPLDVEFNNKDLEKKAAEAIRNINEILSKSRVKNLDLSSILPNFVNEINKEGISDEIRMQMIKGFESALTNLKDIGIKQDYSKLKGFNGEDLKAYIADLNDVMDILKTIEGLTERQKQGILTNVLPSLSDLSGRGKDAAKKEYTKGAKRLDAILQLSGDYNDVLQYGVNPTATLSALNELNKKAMSGKRLTKNEGQDLLGYLLRGKFLGLEFGKAEDENLKDLDYDYLLQSAKESLDKATTEYIENKSANYFAALDRIYKSSAQEITYSDLTKGIKNTTNQKMQSLYDAEAPENPPTTIRAGSITKRAIKLSSKEKPELRKRTQNEDEKYKKNTEKTESQFEDTDEEKLIQDYKNQIRQIDNELRQIDDKLDKAQDKEIQLKKQLPVEENKLKEKERDFQSLQDEHAKYMSSLENAEREKNALENTVASLNQQLEEEKTKRDEIKKTYDKLISEREEIKKTIEDGEKQLEKILPPLDEEINASQEKLNKKQKGLDNEKAWINFYNAPLAQEYKFKNKKEAYERLKQLGEKYREFRENPSSSKWTDKETERMRFVVKHYKAWQAAKEIGIADSRLYNEQFDTDNDYEYQEAIKYLQQHKQREEEIYKEIENEVQQLQDKINKLKQQKKQLNKQLSDDPRKAKENNRKAIEKKEVELNSSDINISKLENQKQQSETELTQITQSIEQNQETKIRYEERLKQLEEERNIQKQIYEEAKRKLQEAQQQQIDLDNRQVELNEKKDQLLEKQKQAEEKLEIKRKEEEQRKKEEAERAAQEDRERTKKEENTEKEQTEETKSEKDATSTSDTSTPPSIPPEKLQEILTLLSNIQKALGTLEDGSDIPSITQSIKGMADALKELNDALGEIKQKNFNLNIGLPNNNPIGQQGEAKRKILKELEQQYNELNSYFVNKYGDDSSAFNALSKLEGGSNYVATMMSDYSVIGDTNASLSDKIEVYKTLIEQLRNFLIQEGGDINKVLTNVLSPEEIINKITDDITKLNPTTAISKIFEDIKVSIDASLAQINTESQGFNLLSGSAEEAAEAKRKFVEANKDVLQSIVASMPKIEQEAEALEKVEDIKNESKSNADIKNNNKENENTLSQQKKLLDQQQLQIRAEQEQEKIQRKFEEIKSKRNARINEQKKQRAQNIKDRIDSRINQPSLQQIEEAQLKEQQKIQQKVQEQLREEVYNDYSKPQRPQYDFEPDYEDLARQAQEARQYYQEQISNDFEIKAEVKLDLVQDETGQLSLFDDILPEQNWGQEIQQNIKEASQAAIEGQISFQQLEEAVVNSEKAFAKLYSSKTTAGKSFIQNKDLPNDVLQKYENISTENGEGYKATSNLRELKNLGDELANIKTKLKVSFDEAGNLKSFADPLEIQSLLERYDELTQKIQRLKLLIESPDSQEFKLLKDTKEAEVEVEKLTSTLEKAYAKLSSSEKITTDTEKLLNPFAEANIPMTESIEQMIDSIGRMRDIHSELASSFDSEGKLIGDPKRVQDLITEYNNLSKVVDELKVKISSPTSKENIALNLAKDAEKAEKQLNDLKEKIDTTLGKSSLFEARTQKTIDMYGAFYSNGEGKRGDLIKSNVDDEKILPKNFIAQQKLVEELVKKLKEYKEAIKELQSLRTSDDATTEQLEETNNKVKDLKDNITTLSQTIKTSGIANASEEQISKLKNSFEIFLDKNPNVAEPTRKQIEKYIETLSSGASVSKSAYSSMTNDLNKFKAAQASGSTIWEQMVGKMREGIAFLATKFSFYQIFNQFRQGFEVIHQFDDALTEMMKVSDETRLSLERYQKTTFDVADSIGTNALQIQNSTADFLRLGESLDQAAESAKTANVLMNVSEFQSIDEATKSLIAMGAAYDDLSKMNIIDKLNEVGNNYAISTSEAATALQSSASALKTAGNNMDEALALVTAGNAVVQDATKVGTGMRTIALRLTGKAMCPNIE